ncbi:uncharacterized protein B0I36DRAFT_377418 [Microdochium trichocladiopsis]|uniref:Apple domain-containing protein n=1 Tax=Microdochium trichocladiopsis TaxID=1682393 RepID=A0A9P9BMP7_9PEZI|nr:uncharacterized protein B0I36DRAFT_377418 [Microdochium trichocladiopsis]KAH7018017.1 hypothetical protein B0I36DRAFT_377418 [Microdochium trichocladiopsis]
MKFGTILVLFTAAVSATAPPTCKGPAVSCCKGTSNRAASECQRLFAENNIEVATCQLPTKTVTSTQTNCVGSTTTKTLAPPPTTTKVSMTITATGTPTTAPTITVTATSTKVDTTILTGGTTATELHTITLIEINCITNTESATTTVTATATLPFTDPQTCRKKRAPAYKVPSSCSCYLTTSKPAATKTVTVTKNLPAVTHTVFKTAGTANTITQTVTFTRYIDGPILSAPETTKTATTTITQTEHTLTTVTESQTTTATQTDDVIDTVTQTKTETATATATADPCDGDLDNPIQQQISGSSIQITSSQDATGPDAVRSCCLACFANLNCVQFRIGDGVCDIFSTVPNFRSACTSGLCPRGFPDLDLGDSDGKDYYLGPCFGTAVA